MKWRRSIDIRRGIVTRGSHGRVAQARIIIFMSGIRDIDGRHRGWSMRYFRDSSSAIFHHAARDNIIIIGLRSS